MQVYAVFQTQGTTTQKGNFLFGRYTKFAAAMDRQLLGEPRVDLCGRTKALAKELAGDKRTQELIMAENECGLEGLMAIAAALEKNSTLENFSLIISAVSPEVGKALAQSLTKNNHLKKLVLDVNKLGPDGAAVLGRALEKNSTLQLLSLSQNEIGAKGAAGLAAGLLKNASVRELHLNENRIGSEGATALSQSIKKLTTLTSLSLDENGIGPDGAAALASYLTSVPLPSLAHLSLKDNSIGEDGGLVLMKAVEVNTRIKTLAIDSNGVSEATRERITKILKRDGPVPLVVKPSVSASLSDSNSSGSATLTSHASTPVIKLSAVPALEKNSTSPALSSQTVHKRSPSVGNSGDISSVHSAPPTPVRSEKLSRSGSQLERTDSPLRDKEKKSHSHRDNKDKKVPLEKRESKKSNSGRSLLAPKGASLSRSGSGTRLRSTSDTATTAPKDRAVGVPSPLGDSGGKNNKYVVESGNATGASASSAPSSAP